MGIPDQLSAATAALAAKISGMAPAFSELGHDVQEADTDAATASSAATSASAAATTASSAATSAQTSATQAGNSASSASTYAQQAQSSASAAAAAQNAISQLFNESATMTRFIAGNFVTSQAEQDAAMNAAPDQSTVFNSWYRFSHNSTDTFPANSSELQAWAYDSTSGQISNTTNSATFIGVVSTEKYDNYILDVNVSSTNTDDDVIGLLLAWYKDPTTGHEYTLSALRSPGGSSLLWGISYNFFQSSTTDGAKTLVNGSSQVKWGNGAAGNLSATAAGYVTNTSTTGWSGQATTYGTDGHIRIRAVRTGNTITVSTSDWSAPGTLISTLTIDLTSDPLLAKFCGSSQYGFCAESQQNSLWNVTQFTNPQDAIYNLATRAVYQNLNGVWSQTTDVTVDDLGTNALLVNTQTGKSFIMKDKDNILVLPSTSLAITAS
jgi:hypothetical protein